MRITPVEQVAGAAFVDLDMFEDERGFFARAFDAKLFAEAGLEPLVEQCNLSFNHAAGTLRGMHYQTAEAPEAKLVRCTRGAVIDVIVDMRADSSTYLQHVAVELSAENHRALYVPPVCAHGYLTLVDDTEVSYQVSTAYTPGAERGLRHDDPTLGITWPQPVVVLSDKDSRWPLITGTAEAPAP